MKKVNILSLQQFHEEEEREGFYVNTLENHLQTRHKDIAVPHKHDFYLAVLFTAGTGVHEIDFTTYAIKPGAVFFLNPGQTHHWKLSADIKGYIFFHTQALYDLHYTHNRLSHFPFFYSMHHSPCLYLNENEFTRVNQLFTMILQEDALTHSLKEHSIISLIDLVYNECTKAYVLQNPVATAGHDNYYSKFKRFEELIEQYYVTEKLPSAYADMLNVSARHLNRITRAVTGKTASDVIAERVLLEAKKEFIRQRQSFSQTAFSLGYDDYAYFSRLFKKKTGETPMEFLKRYRQHSNSI